MATKRMLVDGIHPEETRIVVTSGNRLEEFDFESASRRQLRGNIYLAKVTRVEPSLQAAFIEYGGNRHGFLAFSEIHPDYYQIPVADREALMRDQEADEKADAEEEDAEAESAAASAEAGEAVESAPDADAGLSGAEGEDGHIEEAPAVPESVESIGGADALEEVPQAPRRRMQRYKIQEVIKRRQVMLVQVVKEERGNKGAALTTYLSLAGRYSVLMPNTARGGGISRKITNAADRKRLKEITSDLEVPQGMGVILRTAGASRTKAEVKRDFEYLMRLWENVRSLTLKSQAPCLVYEEGSLIKRTIRDLYNKDIDEVFVAGDGAYREARDFMNMIMPSHSKNVQLYKEDQPLFSKYGIESQLDQMFSPQVTLPSGGYIVINPTEALVSIDVNSGRSTKEHNIEDTALQTNLEAAEEVARQLRLRDLAGLIVIDFIDMMENRSNRAVERKLKDCLKNDRARIQVGRISHFGLMEMSRQRIRFGVVESSTHKCPICDGTGIVRSVESVALMVMRQLEDSVMRRPGQSVNVRLPFDAALYILNTKRETLGALETKYALSITISADAKLHGSDFAIEKGEERARPLVAVGGSEPIKVDSAILADYDALDEPADEATEVDEEHAEAAPAADSSEGESSRRGRRRRRGRRGERTDEHAPARAPQFALSDVAGPADEDEITVEGEESDSDEPLAANGDDSEEKRRRRRRGRRGGRRNRRLDDTGESSSENQEESVTERADAMTAESAAHEADEVLPAPVAEAVAATLLTQDEIVASEQPEVPEKPKRSRRRKTEPAPTAAEVAVEIIAAVAPDANVEAVADEKPKRKPRTRRAKPDATAPEAAPASEMAPEAVAEPEAPAETPATPAPEQQVGANDADGASRRPRRELPPEGVVTVSSSAVAEAEGQPKKKAGWWQRRLGLG